MAESGDLIGRYRVEELIAEGGMSKVYKVRDMRVGVIRAMKEIDTSDDYLFAAYTETQILKSVNYPTLPGITDIVRTEKSYCVVMDFIEGKNLRDIVKENGKFSEKEAIRIACQILDTLIYLHGRKPPIVYCDLKPSNVMITKQGDLKMIDFGISGIYEQGFQKNKFATKEFAAPETISGNVCNERSDIYSFGCTLKYLLPEDISLGMKYYLSICMAHDPKDRFESAAVALRELKKTELLNMGYMDSVKRKIGRTVFCLIMFFLSTAGTVLSEQYKKRIEKAEYETLVKEATQSFDAKTRMEKLEELIVLDTDEEWYLKYFDEIKSDAVFDDKEAEKIEDIIERDEGILTEKGLYCKTSQTIGELYLFYYPEDNGNEKYKRAAMWFEKCREKGGETETYYEVCRFLSDIGTMILEGKDHGMYEKYFAGIKKLVYADFSGDEYTQMLIYELAADSVYAYGSDFYREGVKADEMRNMLERIRSFAGDENDHGSEAEKIREKVIKRIDEAVSEIDYIEGNFN